MNLRLLLSAGFAASLLAFPLVYAPERGSEQGLAWGGFAAAFVFLLALSQYGLVFVALLRLCGARWAEPLFRLAYGLSLAGLPLAVLGFALVLGPGRDIVFVWLAGPHEAGGVNQYWLNAPALWLRHGLAQILFYGLLLWGWRLERRSDERNRPQRLLLAPFQLAAFVLAHTFLAWDFGMLLYPHWHSSIYPIQHWFGSVLAGTAFILLYATHKRALDAGRLQALAQLLHGFCLLWLYLFWAQYLVSWFGNLPQETGPFRLQMEGAYGRWFWLGFALCFALPFLALLFAPVRRDGGRMALIALMVISGVGLQRYVGLLPALTPAPGGVLPLLWALLGLIGCWRLGKWYWLRKI